MGTKRAALAILTFIGLGAAPALAAAPLVDAAWVQANACQAGVVVIDVRDNPRAFARGHVPCAVHGPYRASGWRQEVDGVIGMLPPPEVLAKLIGGLGIGNDSHVVIAGAGGRAIAMTGATRVYWTFKVLGHDKVSLLDGGMAAYRDAGATLEKGDARAPFSQTQQQAELASPRRHGEAEGEEHDHGTHAEGQKRGETHCEPHRLIVLLPSLALGGAVDRHGLRRRALLGRHDGEAGVRFSASNEADAQIDSFGAGGSGPEGTDHFV